MTHQNSSRLPLATKQCRPKLSRLPNLGLSLGASVPDVDELKQRLVEVRPDFEQTIIDEAINIGVNSERLLRSSHPKNLNCRLAMLQAPPVFKPNNPS